MKVTKCPTMFAYGYGDNLTKMDRERRDNERVTEYNQDKINLYRAAKIIDDHHPLYDHRGDE